MCNILLVRTNFVDVVANKVSRVCITLTYIQHMHRVFDVLLIFHVLFSDQISYYNVYSTLWYHVIFVLDQKLQRWKLVCILKFWHICAQHKNPNSYDTPFLFTFFTCPFLLFYLINHSMFTCCIRKLFWNYQAKQNMR